MRFINQKELQRKFYRACTCGWWAACSQYTISCGMSTCKGGRLSARFATKEDLLHHISFQTEGFDKAVARLQPHTEQSHEQLSKEARNGYDEVMLERAKVEEVKARTLSDEELGTTEVDDLFDSNGSITDSANPAIDATLLDNPEVDDPLAWTEDDMKIQANLDKWDKEKAEGKL